MKVMKTSAIQQNKRKTRIYPDHDEAGERAWLRLKQWLPQLVRHELADGCKDFAEMWVRGHR